MYKGIFVTGTDTGVGKTTVCAGLLRSFRRGLDILPMKPVQTGAVRRGGELFAPDLEYCLEAAGLSPAPEELHLMSPFLYEPPCSPHLAGRLAGSCATVSRIFASSQRLLERHDAIVVEGAGGVIVPLNESETMLDLMKALGYPVVLVARIGLGTINHCLLSLQALRSAGLQTAGVIFNQSDPPVAGDRFIEQENPAAVERFGKVDVLGNVRYTDVKIAPGERWAQFEESVPGIRMLRRMLEGPDA